MQFVGKLVTSVSDFYRDLNPATLTGAMDVIVVEDEETGERACTPFHVRIGKLNLMRPQDKRVDFQVNGERIEGVEMKVGEAGEAFFVVPEDILLRDKQPGDDDALSAGEDDLSLLSTSPLPPAPASPPHNPLVALDELNLSPVKTLSNAPATLSDSEVDYSVSGPPKLRQKWLDALEYLEEKARTMNQWRELHQASLRQSVRREDFRFYVVSPPLLVHPVAEYPFVIEEELKRCGRQLTADDLFTHSLLDPINVNRLIVRIGREWWFSGRLGVLIGMSGCMFDQIPDPLQWHQAVYPSPTAAIASKLSSTQPQSSPQPGGWRHWWSRSSAVPTDGSPRPAIPDQLSAPIPIPQRVGEISKAQDNNKQDYKLQETKQQENEKPKRFLKSLRLTSEQLKRLPIRPGANTVTFTFATGRNCQARLFLWPSTSRIVISDIDGTITKSDALGHILTFVGRDWTHSGVAGLYDRISKNGYRLLYLTARAIGQATSTRDYLKNVEQDKCQLPDGPVIMSPDRLLAALRREVIIGNPEEFKIACLQDIQRLFLPRHADPFYAGFGNRFTDAQSYHAVGIPAHRIFTVEPGGELRVEHGLGFASTYTRMMDVVDLFFPPVAVSESSAGGLEQGAMAVQEGFKDYNFWRVPTSQQTMDDLAAFLPPPKSTAVLAGDNIIIIERDSAGEEEEDEDDTTEGDSTFL